MVRIDTSKWDLKTVFSGISLLVSCVIMPIIFIVSLRGDVTGLKKGFTDFKSSNDKELKAIIEELGELRRLHLSNKVAILENKQELHKNLSQIEQNTKKLEMAVATVAPEMSSVAPGVKKKIPH